MIIGVGIDVVPVERFAESLTRTPGLRDRLFTADEQRTPSGGLRTGESLAARFAAKEALAKALGAPGDLHWHDAEVTVGEHGRPHLEVRGTVAGRAAQLGVTSWHISLSHDGGIASAVVVAEGLASGAIRAGARVIALHTAQEVRAPRSRCSPPSPRARSCSGPPPAWRRSACGCSARPTGGASRCWSARATTAGTRCSRAPYSRGAGCGSPPSCSTPTARTRPGWRRSGGRGDACSPPASPSAATVLGRADLVLDGMLGIGGRGGLRPEAAALVRAAADGAGITVAVDVPSGIDADTGAVDGVAFPALHTVTFGAVKPGLVVGEGRGHAGQVHLVDIGLGPHLPPATAWSLTDADAAARLEPPSAGDDKYSQGVVGVVAGSATYPGAGVLCTGAALRTRPGLVRYAGTAADGVRAAWPEAIVTDGRPADAGRVQAWVVGPGMGTDDAARGVLAEVLATDLPVLVDADALTMAAAEPALVRGRSAPTVLTPHDREFARFGVEVGAGPDGRGPPAGRGPRLRRPAQGRRHGGRRRGRVRVRERDGHALAGHGGHRRRPVRDRRRAAGDGPAGRRGGRGGGAPARADGAAGRRAGPAAGR